MSGLLWPDLWNNLLMDLQEVATTRRTAHVFIISQEVYLLSIFGGFYLGYECRGSPEISLSAPHNVRQVLR